MICPAWPWERAAPRWTRAAVETYLVQYAADRRLTQFLEQRDFVRNLATEMVKIELARDMIEAYEAKLDKADDPLIVARPKVGSQCAYAAEAQAYRMVRQCWNQLGLIPSRVIPEVDEETGQFDAFATRFPGAA